MFGNTMVALVTPMLPDGGIDYPALQRLLDLHLQAGTEGLVVLGSTGEGWAIDTTSKVKMVGMIVDYIAQRMPIIVGVGTNATITTITAAKALEGIGIDGILTICPYYNKPTQMGVYQHFTQLADEVDLPVIMYNHPGRTGFDLQPATVARLAEHTNIVGLKEAVVEHARFNELASIANKNFVLYSGDDLSSVQFIEAGAQGVISVAANIVPTQMRAMVTAALQDDQGRVQDLRQSLLPLFTALNIEPNPIPLKWALAEMGYIKNILCSPLMPLTVANEGVVREALLDAGLLGKDNNNAKIA